MRRRGSNVTPLKVEATDIDGLLLVELPMHADAHGWSKENWQREKMVALGLPGFHPVQDNALLNAEAGITRGLHAEPQDEFVSVARNRVLCVWVVSATAPVSVLPQTGITG